MEFVDIDNLDENDLVVHIGLCGFVVVPVDHTLLQFTPLTSSSQESIRGGSILTNDALYHEYKQRVWHVIGQLADKCNLIRIKEIDGGYTIKTMNRNIAIWDFLIDGETYLVFGLKAAKTYTPIDMTTEELENKLHYTLDNMPNLSEAAFKADQ
jgi:hypothetical protein